MKIVSVNSTGYESEKDKKSLLKGNQTAVELHIKMSLLQKAENSVPVIPA
jgi:hypothetical protein